MAELKGPARIDRSKGLRERRMAGALAMNEFQKSLQEGTERRAKRREDLQKITREANQSGDVSERIANLKKTGGKDIDQQIIEQINKQGQRIADLHINAYGPEGNPELIAEYQKEKALINKHLDELTLFVGTLDAEIDARDKAIKDGTIIEQYDENGNLIKSDEEEIFKNGIFNGNSNVSLTYDPATGYSIEGFSYMSPSALGLGGTTGTMGPTTGQNTFNNIQKINLTEYADNLSKNGTGYKQIMPSVEGVMDQYASNFVGLFDGQLGTKVTGDSQEVPNPNFDKSKAPDPKTNPEFVMAKKGYKTTNKQDAEAAIGYQLSGDKNNPKKGFQSITNSQGKPIQLPPEDQMWAFLQQGGYLPKNLNYGTARNVSNNVSWDQYKNPDKEGVLKQGYMNYIMATQFPSGESEDIVEDQTLTYTGKVPIN